MDKILIDARICGKDGIGRYVNNFINRLDCDEQSDYWFITGRKKENVQCILNSSPNYSMGEIEIFNEAINSINDIRILHCTDYKVPFVKPDKVKLVVSIHDIFRYTDPMLCYSDSKFIEKYGKNIYEELQKCIKKLKENKKEISLVCKKKIEAKSQHEIFYKTMLAWAIYCADKIIVPTEHVANEIKNNFNVTNKIVVANYGVDHIGTEYIKKYYLYVGQCRKHKNINMLLQAFYKEYNNKDVYLCLVGKDFVDSNYEWVKLKRQYAECKNIVALGEIPDDKLLGMYQGSMGLFHLARMEGFGFTPIEAVLHGCPVVIDYRNMATKELLNDYVSVINSDYPENITQKMRELEKEYVKGVRNKILEKYQWENYLKITKKIYDELV